MRAHFSEAGSACRAMNYGSLACGRCQPVQELMSCTKERNSIDGEITRKPAVPTLFPTRSELPGVTIRSNLFYKFRVQKYSQLKRVKQKRIPLYSDPWLSEG